MKKISRGIIFSLPFIAALSFLISFDPVWNYIKEFSFDGEIKPTTKEYYKSLFEKGKIAFLILSFIPALYLIFFDKLSTLLNKLVRIFIEKIQIVNNYFSLNIIFVLAFIISFVFMISAVFLFDIGQDPAYYLNDFQNIEKYGHIMRDYDTGGVHPYLTPNLQFNILSYIYVKAFGFSVIGIRFIIVFFTILFIYALYLFLEKEVFKYSFILIFSIPGIYSLTSEIFLELCAMGMVIFGLIYLNKYEIYKKRKFEYFSIFFMVLAVVTKFQFIPYLILVFSLIILIDSNTERRKFLILYLTKTYILIFLVIIATIIPFGYNEMLIYLNWYFVDAAGEGRAFLSSTDIKLFMVNEIIFIPLFIFVIYLYYKYSGNINKHFSFHFIPLFSTVNVIYWLIFFATVTWRNIIYANIFLCIMLATILVYKLNYAKIVLATFFLFGVITNFIFLHHGVIDDVQFLKERYKKIVFERDNSQRTFFNKVSNIIETDANVYVPGLPYLARVYLDNRRIILLEDFEITNENKSFLIYDKEAFGEDYFQKLIEKEYRGDYKSILKVGDYYLYEILIYN